jgi:hypothetical protein
MEKTLVGFTHFHSSVLGKYYFLASKASGVFGETIESKRQRISRMAVCI